MGKIMKNGRSYTYTSAPTTTRFVSDPNNENYGWIQYKDENGEWVNWERAEINSKCVVKDGIYNDEYSFTNRGGSGNTTTITESVTQNMRYVSFTSSTTNGNGTAIFISDQVFDLSKYSKLVLNVTNAVYGSDSASQPWPVIGFTSAATSVNKLVELIVNSKGNKEIDLTNVNSTNAYLYFSMYCGDTGKRPTIAVSDLYLE